MQLFHVNRIKYVTTSATLPSYSGINKKLYSPTIMIEGENTAMGESGLIRKDVYNDTSIHIGRIETSKANLSVDTLSSLCKYFKINLSDF